ncbi:hypothetical protein ACTXT7_012283 [Hymenolepis weldensis]
MSQSWDPYVKKLGECAINAERQRGVCGPTVAMCFLFLYVEVAIRLRDPKTIPLSIDLCRPFAAHWYVPSSKLTS